MTRNNGNSYEPDLTRGLLDSDAEDDPRLVAAVQEYMAASEAGRRPNRQEFLAKHADIANELSVCLNGLNFIQTAAAQIPGTQPPQPDPHADLAARPLGDFKLTREIGRGGMGVVYEAIQLSLGRRVAVKVLSLAAALDPRHLQRFKNEAQAAAQLHHTNIVPVYQVGCERSVHFYAMQLIDGQTLADVVHDLRRLAKRDTPPDKNGNGRTHHGSSDVAVAPVSAPMAANRAPLSTQVANLSVMHSEKRVSFCKSVARIGLQAADALEYAHKLGVVHRDIKPANLMLDVTGNLWITDFGLAQFYAIDSGLTQTGDLVGTYRYMSPEQASGRAVVLDQRTDIYSLGVTLYELLTLERAVPGETRDELLHQISNVDPRSPRLIDKTIPPELDTIIMKSVAKDPSDRYPSAKAFADDLRRFLDDQPILARPPSTFDKAVKWTKRHRAITLSAVVMLLVIATGLAISTILIARAQANTQVAYKRESEKAIEAKQQRDRAERSFQEARNAVEFFTNIAADKMAGRREFASIRKEMLEASLVYYQGFLDERKDDPTTGESLTAARTHVSELLSELAAHFEADRTGFGPMILHDASVQQAIGMRPEQIERFNNSQLASLNWLFSGLSEADRLPPEQGRVKIAAVATQISTELRKVLDPSQRARLQQISRQVRAPGSFSDSDVEEALALTKEQRDAIHTIQAKAPDMFMRGGGPPPGPPPGDRGPGPDQPKSEARNDASPAPSADRGPDRGPGKGFDEMKKRKEEAVNEILALLTDEQRATWQNLTGAPFTGNIFRGGGRGGRRNGGGPG